MNVAIISPEYPPKTQWGGVATYHKMLATTLARLGHQVHVITYDGNRGLSRTTHRDGVTVHYVRMSFSSPVMNAGYFVFPFGVVRKCIGMIAPQLQFTIDWNIFALLDFRTIHRDTPIQIIHSTTYSVPALLVSAFHPKIRTYVHIHGPEAVFNAYRKSSVDTYLKQKLERVFLRYFSNEIIACSYHVLRWVRKNFPALRSKCRCILNATDVPVFRKAGRPDPNRFLYAGSLEHRKGVDLLIRAFSHVAAGNPSVTLDICGSQRDDLFMNGKPYGSIQMFLDDLMIPTDIRQRIRVHGAALDHGAMIRMLQQHGGTAVFPARYEPFGLTTVEAMASGCMVIASRVGGGPEIIRHGRNGYLTAPTARAVEYAMRASISLGTTDRMRMIHRAMADVATRFSSERFASDIERMYRETGERAISR